MKNVPFIDRSDFNHVWLFFAVVSFIFINSDN